MKPFLLKSSIYCKAISFALLGLVICSKAFSQAPPNDDCSGAITLVSGTSCTSTTGTFIGATKSAGVPNSNTATYTANGSWAAPSGYYPYASTVECWAAGGAGSGANGGTPRGSGGGGGAYNSGTFVITPGSTYPVFVGVGGTGVTAGNGNKGGDTYFENPSSVILITANGGKGGVMSPATGGAGGAAGTYQGGNGATAVSGVTPGGGGGGAGSTGAGNNAFFNIAGNGGTGNIGGTGGSAATSGTSNGNPGSTYGGGGSGGIRLSGGSAAGGAGANGFMRITYPTCGDFNSNDVWYKFVAATANPKIVLSNVGTDLALQKTCIQLFSGTCAGLTPLLTSTTSNYPDPNTLSAHSLSIGTTYYIRVTTNSNFITPISGNYNFDICVLDPLPAATNPLIDYSKSFVDITDAAAGGTLNQGDILEIRATLVVKNGASTITNVSFTDTLKKSAGLIFNDSIATRTNEGKLYQYFTPATGDDAGWKAPIAGGDTVIQINMGTGATSSSGGTIDNNTKPNLFTGVACIIVATYRVRLDTGLVGYGRKINFGGGAIRYTIGVTNYVINFPKDSLILLEPVGVCPDGISPANLISNASNGTFGSLTIGSNPSSKQNAGAAASINTTYNYETFSSGPNDYYYGVANNTSATNAINQTAPKGDPTRVFSVWDITGDHTGASNSAKGNKPCDPNQLVSATNPCGYMLAVNASYRSDVVFEYQANGVCTDTYYEVSAWFKNLCYKCGCDVNGKSSFDASGPPYYIPTDIGDSSGVRPNIAMKIDGVDYYTTGDIKYQGLGGTQSGSDTLNNWVRRSFVFKTGPAQSSFKIQFRNNAPGGGGNDWVIDDIGLRTTFPSMNYGPSASPKIFIGNTITLSDTVTSCYKNYVYYKWQKKPAASSTWIDIPGYSGVATPTYSGGTYQYISTYTVSSDSTQAANNGDLYRMVVATNAANLSSVGCNYSPSLVLTLTTQASNPCNVADTNFATTPETAKINWNNLQWSLKHPPTCCESAFITYAGSVATPNDSVVVNITNDICIRNLILFNRATATTTKKFKTVLDPTYKMLMYGNVTMSAKANLPQDSCIFTANGNNNIVITGNTTVGLVGDNAYSIIGAVPNPIGSINYSLKGDSLTFNDNGLTSDKLITVNMVPIKDTAYLTNNTFTAPYPNAVTFENYKVGDAVKRTTVIVSGTNSNNFINSNAGALEVTSNGVLVLPANYTINAKTPYNSNLNLRANSKLRVGGYSGGTTGSNFPANFTTYNINALDTVEYYGGNSATQTVYATTYGRLELRNGTNTFGTGRAQKNSTTAFTAVTSINVNRNTDFTLGTSIGSSAQPVISTGLFNVADSAGLYCNANVVSGTGTFTMGNGSYLGSGHAVGIAASASTGNIQMSGTRTFTTTGNYIYNGNVTQITGDGLPSTVNDLTIDNTTIGTNTVTIASNQIINGTHYLKNGTFDIGTTKVTLNGASVFNVTSGKMKADAGTVEMTGTTGTAQTVSGNYFVNKLVSTMINGNTKGITVSVAPADTMLISKALLFGAATTNSLITTNDNVTLLSRASGTAIFGEMKAGSSNDITGKVNVERFIPNTRKWRLLAWPTNSTQTAKQSLMEGSVALNDNLKPGYGCIVTDEQTNWNTRGFDSRSVSGPSVKYYDPTTNAFIGITNTSSYLMSSHSAYYNYVRGDRTCLPSPVTTSNTILRGTGSLYKNNIAVTIPAGKFDAVGNPYAAAIDIRKIDTLNVNPTFYVWDTKLTGAFGLGAYQMLYPSGTDYRIMPGGGSYPPLNAVVDTIESGQGFMIRAKAVAGTVTFKEAAKTFGARTFNRGAGTPQAEQLFTLLSIVSGGSTTLVDGSMAAYDNIWSNDVDYDDALKLTNTSENVSFKRSNTLLAIERRKDIVADDTLFMNMAGLRIATYKWDIHVNNMTNPGRTAFLIDKYLQTSTSLSLTGLTTLQFDVNNTTGTYAPDRFMIVFKQIPMPTSSFTLITAVRNADKTVKVNWNVNNEVNIANYTIEHSNDGTNFTAIGNKLPTANNSSNTGYSLIDSNATINANWYRIKLNTIFSSNSYSPIAMVSPLAKDAIIEEPKVWLSSNPIIGNSVNIHFDYQPKGKYVLSIFNALGQQINVETVDIQTNSVQKSISLKNVAKGTYQLLITDEQGNKSTLSFLVN